jgi:hypothetical protein
LTLAASSADAAQSRIGSATRARVPFIGRLVTTLSRSVKNSSGEKLSSQSEPSNTTPP